MVELIVKLAVVVVIATGLAVRLAHGAIWAAIAAAVAATAATGAIWLGFPVAFETAVLVAGGTLALGALLPSLWAGLEGFLSQPRTILWILGGAGALFLLSQPELALLVFVLTLVGTALRMLIWSPRRRRDR